MRCLTEKPTPREPLGVARGERRGLDQRLAQREAEQEKEAPSQEPYEGFKQDEFAERAARRLETVAGRLEQKSKRLGVEDGETLARAQELRVAAFMVRDEAKAAVREATDGTRDGRRLLRAVEEVEKGGL